MTLRTSPTSKRDKEKLRQLNLEELPESNTPKGMESWTVTTTDN
jgi:hypothetical protein